jgi:hypothetical protein|tara:strand:- start:364 stop:654 length:291 start_codon:yes stop_codon:yes gene_type:complete
MNNVSRLLLKRAEKAERVLATMVKANDAIEAICDEEIGKLKARIVELEARVLELEYEDEPYIEDEDGTIAHMRMLERQAEEASERDRVLYGPVPHD